VPDEAKPGAETPDNTNESAPPTRPPGVAGAHKRGVVARATDAVVAPLTSVRVPALDWKIVSYGLMLLLAIILVVRNWAPVRINVFGYYLDPPKAIAFALFFLLGAATLWFCERRLLGRKPAAASVTVPDEFGEDDEYEAASPLDEDELSDELI
jgi:uncharacterized integral membrane protein